MAATKALKTVFDSDHIVELSTGSHVRVPRWSVRKAMSMSSTIAKIIERFFRKIEKAGDEDVGIADFISAIPMILEENASDLTFVVVESLTLPNGEQQLTDDQVLDDLNMDDFCDVLGAILERNMGEKSLGKWKGLLKKIPIFNQETQTTPEGSV